MVENIIHPRLKKVFSSEFSVGYLDRYTPEEGQCAQRPKHCGKNNEDNRSNVCSVNNCNLSYKKFRQELHVFDFSYRDMTFDVGY